MKLGSFHKTETFYKQIFSNITAFPVIVFLKDNAFCLTLFLDCSPRVPPETKRGRIEKNESKQPAGTVHEMQH